MIGVVIGMGGGLDWDGLGRRRRAGVLYNRTGRARM